MVEQGWSPVTGKTMTLYLKRGFDKYTKSERKRNEFLVEEFLRKIVTIRMVIKEQD